MLINQKMKKKGVKVEDVACNVNHLRYKVLNEIKRKYEDHLNQFDNKFVVERIKEIKDEINDIIQEHPDDIIKS